MSKTEKTAITLCSTEAKDDLESSLNSLIDQNYALLGKVGLTTEDVKNYKKSVMVWDGESPILKTKQGNSQKRVFFFVTHGLFDDGTQATGILCYDKKNLSLYDMISKVVKEVKNIDDCNIDTEIIIYGCGALYALATKGSDKLKVPNTDPELYYRDYREKHMIEKLTELIKGKNIFIAINSGKGATRTNHGFIEVTKQLKCFYKEESVKSYYKDLSASHLDYPITCFASNAFSQDVKIHKFRSDKTIKHLIVNIIEDIFNDKTQNNTPDKLGLKVRSIISKNEKKLRAQQEKFINDFLSDDYEETKDDVKDNIYSDQQLQDFITYGLILYIQKHKDLHSNSYIVKKLEDLGIDNENIEKFVTKSIKVILEYIDQNKNIGNSYYELKKKTVIDILDKLEDKELKKYASKIFYGLSDTSCKDTLNNNFDFSPNSGLCAIESKNLHDNPHNNKNDILVR